MNKKDKERLEAIADLLAMGIKPGSTIQTILRSVSRSGMNRKISLVFEGKNISWYVAKVFKETPKEVNGQWAINAQGCGMDMGFDAVYNLGRYLFPEGFRPIDAGKKNGRNGTSAKAVDSDGGYALNQQWL